MRLPYIYFTCIFCLYYVKHNYRLIDPDMVGLVCHVSSFTSGKAQSIRMSSEVRCSAFHSIRLQFICKSLPLYIGTRVNLAVDYDWFRITSFICVGNSKPSKGLSMYAF